LVTGVTGVHVRALALDLGSRRVGVAVGDGASGLAFPRDALQRAGGAGGRTEDHRRLAALVADEGVDVVVVGLPRSLDGSLGPAARAALAEVDELRTALPVPVEVHDERLTTVAADRALAGAGVRSRERRSSIDSAAAALLLESWFATRTAGS
jgi:putative Holliday junction resolvase